MSTWPTTWDDLDWTDPPPNSVDHCRAIYSAVLERRHACYSATMTMPTWCLPVPYGHISRDWCASVRDAIYAMTPLFVNMAYDYADNEWLDFPKMLTVHDVLSVSARNIAQLPAENSPIIEYAGWLVKAKACLDMLYMTLPHISVMVLNQVHGSYSTYDGMDEAIEGAYTWDVTRSTLRGYPLYTFYRYWEIRISRQAADGELHPLLYSAEFYQKYNMSIQHVSPFAAVLVFVARKHVLYDDPDNTLNIFDAMGKGWTVGLNPQAKLTDHETRVIDDDDSILALDTVPTIPPPEVFFVADPRCCGYDIVPCLDWRSADAENPDSFHFFKEI